MFKFLKNIFKRKKSVLITDYVSVPIQFHEKMYYQSSVQAGKRYSQEMFVEFRKVKHHNAAFARGIERLISDTSPEYVQRYFVEHYEIVNKEKK